MMIRKVNSEREEARQKDNRENKKMLDEILHRLDSLETIIKLLVEVEKEKKMQVGAVGGSVPPLPTLCSSHLWMDKAHQPKSRRPAWSPQRKITRARRKARRSTPRCCNTS